MKNIIIAACLAFALFLSGCGLIHQEEETTTSSNYTLPHDVGFETTTRYAEEPEEPEEPEITAYEPVERQMTVHTGKFRVTKVENHIIYCSGDGGDIKVHYNDLPHHTFPANITDYQYRTYVVLDYTESDYGYELVSFSIFDRYRDRELFNLSSDELVSYFGYGEAAETEITGLSSDNVPSSINLSQLEDDTVVEFAVDDNFGSLVVNNDTELEYLVVVRFDDEEYSALIPPHLFGSSFSPNSEYISSVSIVKSEEKR